MWSLINCYFNKRSLRRLVRHQLDSFNYFINHQMEETISMFNPLIVRSINDFDAQTQKYYLEIEINFSNLSICRPLLYENSGASKVMFPQSARLRNFTYWSTICIDLEIKYKIRWGKKLNKRKIIIKYIKNVKLGKMPIMLKSQLCTLKKYKYLNSDITGECKYDTGGYFIINGSEKTILCQERAAENIIYCFTNKKNKKWKVMAEIKSTPLNKCISPKQISLFISKKNNEFGYPIYIQIPRVKTPLPIFVIFRILGVISDKEICQYILLNIDDKINKDLLYKLKASILDGSRFETREKSFNHMVSNVIYTPINMTKEMGEIKKIEFANQILKTDLFPHCSDEEIKKNFMGYMVLQLLKS